MTQEHKPENSKSADTAADDRLIAALDNPLAFGHPLRYLRLIETHISWILLTGDYAYKIKKPVDFGFLDFSTLEKRRFYCNEELRLNRRFAPEIYLELVEIRGSRDKPRMHGRGDVVEYAIKMLEFPQQDLLSAYADNQLLQAEHIDAIADTLSEVHAGCESCAADSDFGDAESVARWSDENITHLVDAIPAELMPSSFHELEQWYRHGEELAATIAARKREGFVRECHGDCHLGNMAMIDNRLTLFDCIEFNPELRWIDTISEAAFVAMDLYARGYPAYCWRFINRYLANSGDYAGVRLLRYYFVYRALVRAKVEALRVEQESADSVSRRELLRPAFDYIELAHSWAGGHSAALIVMHGLSGSGKSTVAAQLARYLGAVHIRSDVERKRLHRLAPEQDSGSALGQGIYSIAAGERTYRRLAQLAQYVIDSDFGVIVDATFLQASQRRLLLSLETVRKFRRIIVHCDAPEAELQRRIRDREKDPSEADLAVLQRQLRTQEPISEAELRDADLFKVDAGGLDDTQLEAIGRLFSS